MEFGIERHKRVKVSTQVRVTASQLALPQAWLVEIIHAQLCSWGVQERYERQRNRMMCQVLEARGAEAHRVTADGCPRPTGEKRYPHTLLATSAPWSSIH